MKYINNVVDFGAESANGLQTAVIQKAIDDCFLHGGGEVIIPEGNYLTGGLRLRSNVTIHLLAGAILSGSRNPLDYMAHLDDKIEPISECKYEAVSFAVDSDRSHNRDKYNSYVINRWNNALIRAINATNITIIGDEGSELNGNDCFDEKGEEGFRGPHMIDMHCCKNVTFKGYKVVDSANWAHALFECENISADKVTVIAGHDGFHVRSCDNVTVRDCVFYSGDDCVAGFDVTNMVIDNCIINTSCNGLRLGGRNILVKNCSFFGPGKYAHRGSLTIEEKKANKHGNENSRYNMLSAFDYLCDDSRTVRELPGNIVLRDCEIKNVDRLLQYNFSGNDPWQSYVPLQSITFENIKATGIERALVAYGDKETKLALEFKGLDFSFRDGCENNRFIEACNCERITLSDVQIENIKNKNLIMVWSDDIKTEFVNLDCPIEEKERVALADKPFFSERI